MSDTAKMMVYDAKKKSTGVAYLLWLILGGIGAHRFYAGNMGTGWAYVALQVVGWITAAAGFGLLCFIAIGVWWVIDAFLIPGMIRTRNLLLAAQLNSGAMVLPS